MGTISVALGGAGILIPLLPTTPFLLLAAWCFMNSSPRLNHWLLHHPRLGPPIRSWKERGAISTSAKVIATTTIAASGVLSTGLISQIYLKILVIVVLFGALIFIWSRPN